MKSKDYEYLDTVIYDNFHELLKGRYENSKTVTAVRYFNKNEIVDVTYQKFIREICCVYAFLKTKGIKDMNIAIVMENRYEYLTVYLASIFGNVCAPIDKEADSETIAKCFTQFDIKTVVYSDKTADKVNEALTGKDIIRINIDECFSEIIKDSEAKEKELTDMFFENTKDTDKDKFAVLATTSGTDGKIKGVMLSQYNIITNIRGTLENNILGNPTLAFLPMNHTYGMNPCILATFYNGTTLCLCLGIKYFSRDLKAFNPDFFGAVPLVIESIYNNIEKEAKRRKAYGKLKAAIALSQFLRFFHIDIRHKLFGDLLAPNLTKIVNGGAPLNAYYVKKFDQIGIKILNGYGLTECSPTVAVSREFNNVPGSAGTIMKNIDVKIADDGEILVKGPCVMLGYYKDEEATKECMEGEYIKTGDVGYTVGRVIFVTGRKKNLIVLENGKKVVPEMIEEKINVLSYVADSLIVPRTDKNGNTIITALVRFTQESEADMAEERFKEDLKNVNKNIPSFMKVEDYEVMKEDFEKTSTTKIKRNLYR